MKKIYAAKKGYGSKYSPFPSGFVILMVQWTRRIFQDDSVLGKTEYVLTEVLF